ncbi:MAG: hypothetical protein V3U86_11175, partial [Acidobacteriota bacterium]
MERVDRESSANKPIRVYARCSVSVRSRLLPQTARRLEHGVAEAINWILLPQEEERRQVDRSDHISELHRLFKLGRREHPRSVIQSQAEQLFGEGQVKIISIRAYRGSIDVVAVLEVMGAVALYPQ